MPNRSAEKDCHKPALAYYKERRKFYLGLSLNKYPPNSKKINMLISTCQKSRISISFPSATVS